MSALSPFPLFFTRWPLLGPIIYCSTTRIWHAGDSRITMQQGASNLVD